MVTIPFFSKRGEENILSGCSVLKIAEDECPLKSKQHHVHRPTGAPASARIPAGKVDRTLEILTSRPFTALLDKIGIRPTGTQLCTSSGFGEPLLDPTLIKKIEYARKKDFNVLMLTNASLLTMDRFKAIDDLGVSSIRVSLLMEIPRQTW